MRNDAINSGELPQEKAARYKYHKIDGEFMSVCLFTRKDSSNGRSHPALPRRFGSDHLSQVGQAEQCFVVRNVSRARELHDARVVPGLRDVSVFFASPWGFTFLPLQSRPRPMLENQVREFLLTACNKDNLQGFSTSPEVPQVLVKVAHLILSRVGPQAFLRQSA